MIKNIKKIIIFSTILLFVVCFLFISSINGLAEEENPITNYIIRQIHLSIYMMKVRMENIRNMI